jgi:hypothetical protein
MTWVILSSTFFDNWSFRNLTGLRFFNLSPVNTDGTLGKRCCAWGLVVKVRRGSLRKQKDRFTDRIINQVSERLPKTFGAAKIAGFDFALPALRVTESGGLAVAAYDDAPEADNMNTCCWRRQ